MPNVSLPLKETRPVFSVLWSICIVGVYRKGWLSFAACLFVSRDLCSAANWFESLVEYISSNLHTRCYSKIRGIYKILYYFEGDGGKYELR
jgi:hypothetical protein